MKRVALPLLTLCLWVALPAQADIYVVASAQSPLKAGSVKDIQALFMGRTRTLGDDNTVAQPVDLPRDNELRNQFYKLITGWSPAQVNSYWARLLFTGQVTPPLPLPTETAVVAHLSRNPKSVGYLPQPPVDGKLKVLLVLRADAEPDDPRRGP
ncbi:hypothetical protein [Hydrogenophaga soli]